MERHLLSGTTVSGLGREPVAVVRGCDVRAGVGDDGRARDEGEWACGVVCDDCAVIATRGECHPGELV